jgi:trimethylamine-N-oxide reductase cytochrome c-type subunit TorC
MERFVSLDKEQTRMLQKYLQVHAKDTGGRDASH